MLLKGLCVRRAEQAESGAHLARGAGALQAGRRAAAARRAGDAAPDRLRRGHAAT